MLLEQVIIWKNPKLLKSDNVIIHLNSFIYIPDGNINT